MAHELRVNCIVRPLRKVSLYKTEHRFRRVGRPERVDLRAFDRAKGGQSVGSRLWATPVRREGGCFMVIVPEGRYGTIAAGVRSHQ